MRPAMLFAALALLVSALPSAAMMLQVSLDEAVTTAESIVHARVVGRLSAFDPATRTIHTDVTLEILDAWKGDALTAGKQITVRVMGGEVEGLGMWQEHEPRFGNREETLLLLEAAPEGRWAVQHLEQGKFHVESGQVTDMRGRVTSLAGFKTAVSGFLRSPRR